MPFGPALYKMYTDQKFIDHRRRLQIYARGTVAVAMPASCDKPEA